MSDSITRDERRELRTIVKLQYKTLRGQVGVRTQEMTAEVEREVLETTRTEDAAIAEAKLAVKEIMRRAQSEIGVVAEALRKAHPDLTVDTGSSSIYATNNKRAQIRRDLLNQIPHKARAINTTLDQQEAEVLTKLAKDALVSEDAIGFLDNIPALDQVAPEFTLRAIEADIAKTKE